MKHLAVLAVMTLFAGCQAPPPPEMTDAERAQIVAEIMEFSQLWMDVWEENNCEAAASFLHPTDLSFLWQGEALNRSDWLDVCAPVVALRESWVGSWAGRKVQVLTPDAAIFVGTFADTIRFTSGVLRHWTDNSQMGLVERTPEGWVFTTFGATAGPAEDIEEGG